MTGLEIFALLSPLAGAAGFFSAAPDFTAFWALAAVVAEVAKVALAALVVAGFLAEAAAVALTASDLTISDLAISGLTASGLALTAGDLGGGAVVVLALPTTAALAALAGPLAATDVLDVAFSGAEEAFEAGFVDALVVTGVLGVDPCERGDEVFVADLADFASFFEDAILIAP